MPAKNLAATKKSEPGMVVTFPEDLKNSDAELSLGRAHERTVAIAAEDLHVASTKEVSQLLIAGKDNPPNSTKCGLEKLRAQGQLTAPEFNSMSEICQAAFAAQGGKIDIQTAYAIVRGVYDALLVDQDSSPMALAIASLASGALASDLGATPKTAAPDASRSNGDVGRVSGIIAGGPIGGAIDGAGAPSSGASSVESSAALPEPAQSPNDLRQSTPEDSDSMGAPLLAAFARSGDFCR